MRIVAFIADASTVQRILNCPSASQLYASHVGRKGSGGKGRKGSEPLFADPEVSSSAPHQQRALTLRYPTSTPSGTDSDRLRAPPDEEIEADDVPYDPDDSEAVEEFWKDAVVIRGGGPEAVRKALDERRRRRGAQKAPTEISTTIGLSPEVVDYFKAGGKGWQTRIDEALKEWISGRGT